MKLNHKFKLVPIDEETKHVASLQEKMTKVATSKTLPDDEKVAIYEDLLARLKNYKESINYDKKQSPTFVLDNNQGENAMSNALENPSKAELVINGTVAPISAVRRYEFQRGLQSPNALRLRTRLHRPPVLRTHAEVPR